MVTNILKDNLIWTTDHLDGYYGLGSRKCSFMLISSFWQVTI